MRAIQLSMMLMILSAAGCSGGGNVQAARSSTGPSQTLSAARVQEHVCDDFHYRPTEVLIACGDGNVRVERLHWSQWTPVRAVGVGTWQQNDCRPDCADGNFHDYPVQLTLDEPMGRAVNPFFGRVVADFPGVTPPYAAYRSGHAVLMNHGRFVS